MNIKRAFLAAVAVLMLPGLAMAQSTVFFDVGANFSGSGDTVMAYLSCNAGVPLEQEAEVGGPDRVNFTVTEFVPGSCTVSFGTAPEGQSLVGININAGVVVLADTCVFDANGLESNEAVVATNNKCTAVYEATPVEYEVDVAWEFTDDADESLADDAMVAIMCDGETYFSTTLDASPDSLDLPFTTNVTPESDCGAYLMNVGSAVVSDDDDCDVSFEVGDTEGVSCVITAGVFFEGIPTLSQYGMAIMALLMLAVGFVGFRRFV